MYYGSDYTTQQMEASVLNLNPWVLKPKDFWSIMQIFQQYFLCLCHTSSGDLFPLLFWHYLNSPASCVKKKKFLSWIFDFIFPYIWFTLLLKDNWGLVCTVNAVKEIASKRYLLLLPFTKWGTHRPALSVLLLFPFMASKKILSDEKFKT